MNQFNQNVLLEMYRSYSKDEAVAFLKASISELQIEIGIMKTEQEEKKFNYLKELNILKTKLEKCKKEKEQYERGE